MTFLTKLPPDPLLDLQPWVGQRQATFRFARSNGVTGQVFPDLTPLRGATLTHDTSRTIKRQLQLSLGAADTAVVNTVSDRVDVYMVFPSGVEYPLGRFMFTDATRQKFTSGKLGQMALNDEMFLVDQQITEGLNGVGAGVTGVIQAALKGLPIDYTLEPSSYVSADSWTVGTGRGQVLEALSITGDYFSPWFGNDKKLHFIRTFDPATQVPDFDFDTGNKVIREPILETDDLLTAPNRFVVISNASSDPSTETVGTYDVPPTAPHSIVNRGFVIPQVRDLQITNTAQATGVAQGLGMRQTVFERVSLSTVPDPRHDSYNVIRWQGELWLELAWSMALTEGGEMNHLLRKSYTP
jgi:hypothetical protein